jgi:hypothetical protein
MLKAISRIQTRRRHPRKRDGELDEVKEVVHVATWQFDFHLIPAASVARLSPAQPLTISPEQYDSVDWWAGVDLRQALEQELTTLLPRGTSWDEHQDTWGREDGNRFDVFIEEDKIAEVYGRIDVRQLSAPFLDDVVEMARKLHLVFLTEDRQVLRPSVEDLFAAIQRSRSFAFVSDPTGFLNRLSNKSAK